MVFSKSPVVSTSKLPKGQMRCYQCRVASLLKEGAWREVESQQVFLCKTCGRNFEQAAKKKALNK